jgi:hypothetical protein
VERDRLAQRVREFKHNHHMKCMSLMPNRGA